MLGGGSDMRGLAIILSGLLGAGVTLSGSPGYLPKVGPTSLRFQTPASPSPRVPLPSLRMDDTPSQLLPAQGKDTSAGQTPEPAGAPPSPVAGDSLSAQSNPLTQPTPLNQASTNSAAPPSGSDNDTRALLSPQMFLRFFLPSETNASRKAVIVAPPGFVPARPVPSPSSSATYTAPKP